jgi:5-methylcytosine-specific restriction endonuclease McrA
MGTVLDSHRLHTVTGNPRRTNGHRRTQLRRRVLAAYTTCALCGQPVDKTLPHLDDWAAEVDEIIPVSLGGSPDRWTNVQLAHRICNRTKGNSTHPPTVAVPTAAPVTSRPW